MDAVVHALKITPALKAIYGVSAVFFLILRIPRLVRALDVQRGNYIRRVAV